MKKRSITLIIWLMSIALIGVMGMQYFFIRESYHQKAQIFDETINATLSAVANKLERQEVYDFADEQEKINQARYIEDQRLQMQRQLILDEQIKIQDELNRYRIRNFNMVDEYNTQEKELQRLHPEAQRITNTFFETYIRRPEYHNLVGIHYDEKRDFNEPTLMTVSIVVGAKKRIPEINPKDDSTRFIIPVGINRFTGEASGFFYATLPPEADKDAIFKIKELEDRLIQLNRKKLSIATNLLDSVAILGGKDSELMAGVATSLAMSQRPLKERVKPTLARDYLQDELLRRGIDAPFVMQILSNPDQRPILQQASHTQEDVQQQVPTDVSTYSIPLFQGDQGSSPGLLSIYFPSKRNIIISDMSNYLILPVLALLALLVGCFAYTLIIIFKQKKISEMKTDFINNMTHEFKTPVATIMIASESLRDPEISSNGNRVNKLANIIYDENVRLGSHIERVLNIARLEKENLKIERNKVHINDLVSDVLQSMQLQLDKAGGKFNIDLRAAHDMIIGDELHLSNVMFNLIDNAIKYSKDEPEITVKTYNNRNNIVVSVKDKGIGMSKEHQDRIFEQFYRIPTGNIHNVKGFGLGLSYVNNIIRILNGKISVKSEKDKGTQFEVTLPLKGNKEPEPVLAHSIN